MGRKKVILLSVMSAVLLAVAALVIQACDLNGDGFGGSSSGSGGSSGGSGTQGGR